MASSSSSDLSEDKFNGEGGPSAYQLFQNRILAAFKAKWSGIDKATEVASTVSGLPGNGDVATMVAHCKTKLGGCHMVENMNLVDQNGVTHSYLSAVTMTNVGVLVDLNFKPGFPGCKCVVRSDKPQYTAILRASVEGALKM